MTTNNGGRDFSAELFSASNTASIGAGAEFTLRLTAGDFGGGSNENFVTLDFDPSGDVVAAADVGFFYGAFYFSDFASFDVTIDFTDPTLGITNAVTSGDLIAGFASTTGLDPVTWTFSAEFTGFGDAQREIGFGPLTGNVPVLSSTVDATPVPLPAALPLMAVAITGLGAVPGLRRRPR